MSYKPEVIAGNSGWAGNSCRFATEAEALAHVKDLASRWSLVRETRVVKSGDPVNYEWTDNGSHPIKDVDPCHYCGVEHRHGACLEQDAPDRDR